MKIILSIFSVVSMAISAQGLSCWVCDNAKSNDDCIAKGRLQRCQSNERACQNQVRRGSYGTLIWKQCKQARACDNNFIQNPRAAWVPSQCNTRTPSSVCRCCCNFDECNKGSLECEERPPIEPRTRNQPLTCFQMKVPRNGRMQCYLRGVPSPRVGRVDLGTECTFSCNNGYMLIGASRSMCDRDPLRELARFNQPQPMCRSTKCFPRQRKPQSGTMRCTGRNLGDDCSFQCDDGFTLVGSPSITCLSSRRWSNNAPTCTRVICIPPHASPANGLVTCSNTNERGSECRFECVSGYTLMGIPLSTCVESPRNPEVGEWSSLPPTCREILCPQQIAPSNGDVNCGDLTVESRCQFSCDNGFSLVGESQPTCVDDGNGDSVGEWSTPPPICQEIFCPPLLPPSNGAVNCEDATVGSTCQFSCDNGFSLVGESQSTCVDDGNGNVAGEWSTPPPICREILCLALLPPTDGFVECGDLTVGSTCQFSCDNGFSLVGESQPTCVDSGNGGDLGEWSTPPPICQEILCPQQIAPSNGDVNCGDLTVGSTCLFSCDLGFSLVGESQPTCVDDGNGDSVGEWSTPPPICQEIFCPPLLPPSNGAVNCEDATVGSTCQFSCDNGFSLVGESQPTCVDDGNGNVAGEWSTPPPICREILCPQQIAPSNGDVNCGDLTVGSTCLFSCDLGFSLVGESLPTCVDDGNGDVVGEWTTPPPICQEILCPLQIAPFNGAVSCEGVTVGSRCQFSCDDGFSLVGESQSTCVDDGNGNVVGEWTNMPPPSCQEILCPALLPPTDGFVECGDLTIGSTCQFSCDIGFSLVGESQPTCFDDGNGDSVGEWSTLPPICQENTCEKLGPINNGEIGCTNEEFVLSTCNVECNEENGFTIYPPTSNELICLPNGSWDRPTPCCSRSCPPYALMDLVLVMDSSSSIGNDSWDTMTTFIRNIIDSFEISSDYSRIAVIRYNRHVDVDNQIRLSDFPDDKPGLLAEFDTIPYDGAGTRTGNAIRYVSNVILTEENGDRPNVRNVVLTITDGQAQDGGVLRTSARALRRSGALTYAVGIGTNLDPQQMLDLAGSQENLLVAEEGFSGLNDMLSLRISNEICESRCEDNDRELTGRAPVEEERPPRK